jgi:hypothetical protein
MTPSRGPQTISKPKNPVPMQNKQTRDQSLRGVLLPLPVKTMPRESAVTFSIKEPFDRSNSLDKKAF